MAKMRDLFEAYQANDLPTDGGLIITSRFDPNSTYSIYEVTSYANVKDIYRNEDGLVFQADGYKQYVLVEPAVYNEKHVEPAMRDKMHWIPYRFKEVDIHVSKRQDKVMIGKEPVISYGSFTVLEPAADDFATIAYRTDDLLEAVEELFATSLWRVARVPKTDAATIAGSLKESIRRFASPAQE